MAVRIRLKKMGRTHRPFYRVCAFDHHTPRDGRALEELGTYDTSVPETDARAILKKDRIDYWMSVGAQPTEKVAVLIKKYGTEGTHAAQQEAALQRLAAPRSAPNLGAPVAAPEPAAPENTETAEADTAAAPESAETTEPAKTTEATPPATE